MHIYINVQLHFLKMQCIFFNMIIINSLHTHTHTRSIAMFPENVTYFPSLNILTIYVGPKITHSLL